MRGGICYDFVILNSWRGVIFGKWNLGLEGMVKFVRFIEEVYENYFIGIYDDCGYSGWLIL